MTFATFNTALIDTWFPELWVTDGVQTSPQTMYLALFRDTDGDSVFEYNTELSFFTVYVPVLGAGPVEGYSRQPVSFSIAGVDNGIVTMSNTNDIVWTNTGSASWPTPNRVAFSYQSTPSGSQSGWNNTRIMHISITTAESTIDPGGRFTIPAGKLRIVY